MLLIAGCTHPTTKVLTAADEVEPDTAPLFLGRVMIDPARRALIATGFVNQVAGTIELLACGPGGKTHESIFVLYADAPDIHAGLLLLGLKHGPPMPGLGEAPPQGDPVIIDVEWRNEQGRRQTARAETFIYDYQTRRAVRHGAWIFNGSKIENGYYLARAEESLIATYWDPWAIINLQSIAGSDDDRLLVDQRTVPPLHTPIRLVIRPVDTRPRTR